MTALEVYKKLKWTKYILYIYINLRELFYPTTMFIDINFYFHDYHQVYIHFKSKVLNTFNSKY